MDDAVERIYQALLRRELNAEDLSARRIASFLDRTTGAVYHRWPSLDVLLFEVSQRGFIELAARLDAAWKKAHRLADCAETYVEFGLEQPELYPLMFERRFDWAKLREAGAFQKRMPGGELLAAIVCLLKEAGSKRPTSDTRLLMAGLHGLVSFAASGRMNTGELTASDRNVAVAAARDLATRLTPPATTTETKKKRTR